MVTFKITALIATILILLAFALLGIGMLLTGKSKLKMGACGRFPFKKKKDASCGEESSCELCKTPPKDDKKDLKDNKDINDKKN